MTTGRHESLTNLLHHAYGDLLQLELWAEADELRVVFSGNGYPPAGKIREIGGLRSLRKLTEQNGGTVTVTAGPTICVSLKLPKEDAAWQVLSAHTEIRKTTSSDACTVGSGCSAE